MKLVGATGFEPATTCPPGRCATRLRYAPKAANDTGVKRRTKSVAQQIEHRLDFAADGGQAVLPFLPDHARLLAQALPRADDRETLAVKQVADFTHGQHVFTLVVAAIAAALGRT